jgi:hypothetical protein
MLKFLLLILLVAAVWYGWRYINRKPANNSPVASGDPRPEQARKQAPAVAEDLKPCPVCGTYMVVDPNQPADQASRQTCGRPDCRPA